MTKKLVFEFLMIWGIVFLAGTIILPVLIMFAPVFLLIVWLSYYMPVSLFFIKEAKNVHKTI